MSTARLTNGPAIPEGQDHLDIVRAYMGDRAEPWIRMAPVGGAAGWTRLPLDSPAFDGEVLYELAVKRAITDDDGGEPVYVYVFSAEAQFVPDSVWAGKGGAARYRLRVLYPQRNGMVRIERISGAPDETLRRPMSVAPDQLMAAYTPTGERDAGAAEEVHDPPTNPDL